MPEFHLATRPLLRSTDEGADTALWLAARRPDQNTAEGIWFDRGLRPAHFLPGTASGAVPAALVSHLQEQLEATLEARDEAPAAVDTPTSGSVVVEKSTPPRAQSARTAG